MVLCLWRGDCCLLTVARYVYVLFMRMCCSCVADRCLLIVGCRVLRCVVCLSLVAWYLPVVVRCVVLVVGCVLLDVCCLSYVACC